MDKKKLKQVALYQVGYGKPPEETQFVKGQSGNPKGRPKGAKNKSPLIKPNQFNQIFSQSMQELVANTNDPSELPKPTFVALLDKLKVMALGGDLRALQFLIKTSNQIDQIERERSEKILEKMHDYKVITTAVIRDRKNKGIPIDDILPHPDHVHLDLRTVEVHLSGPSNKKEKDLWNLAHAAIKQLIDQIQKNSQTILNLKCDEEIKKCWNLIVTDIDHLNDIKEYFASWDIIIPWDDIKICIKSIQEKYPNL